MVNSQFSNVQDFTPAELNRPITIGGKFWSGPDGRGEIQTENAAMRFSGGTNLVIEDLSDQATQIKLTSGLLNVRLHTLAPRESFEVDTPHRSFQLTRIGQYRIEIEKNGDELMTVRLGEADSFKENGETEAINQGMQARVTDDKSQQARAPAIDEFDRWCIERDEREDRSISAHYVSRDIPGYADLDPYGSWRNLPSYGAVWFPNNMDPDWVPDRFGHFVQVDPWDANWVEDKPWGFAPFHYGRWVNVRNEWGWVPPSSANSDGSGTRFAVRPYYAPALVAFAKFPAGTVRHNEVVGWFPLGPGEAWVPSFNASHSYLTRVNVSNTSIGDQTVLDTPDVSHVAYANREAAMTAIPSDAFASGRRVDKQFVRIAPHEFARAVISPKPGVEFTQQARLGPLGKATAPPPGIANRMVISHRLPPLPSATAAHGVPTSAHIGSIAKMPQKPAGNGLLGSFSNAAKNVTKKAGNVMGINKQANKSKTTANKRAVK